MENASDERRIKPEVQQLVESLASDPKFPQYPFLVEGLTFEQLYCQADAIRIQFIQNIDKVTPLCLCVENRGHMAAALLAVLRDGPPLLLPYGFAADTLKEARQSIAYTHALAQAACDFPAGVERLPWPEISGLSRSRSARKYLPCDSPWLYLFTGGSTGTPKIWSKTPRNLLMEVAYLARTFNITSSDTILATVPSNHIYGLLYSILLPLVSGARVSLFTPTFPNEIIQCLKQTKATVLVSIPAHYRALKESPITGHHVRLAFSSAGALREQDGLDFYNATGIAITEIYGSTETGGIALRNRILGNAAFSPYACVAVQIKDEHLWVCSDFLSKELNINAEGFFETADRAVWAGQSEFVVLGRSDGIVKVAGKRVDLAELRETLMHVEGVRDAYVFALPVRSGRENEIIALVEGRVTADQINQAACLHLPSHARPRTVRITNRIPLSSTGKYNHDAIKALFRSGAS